MKRPGERGATAVLVALMMVALLGVAAIAVDMGALWWDRKQLQNGADAGALAIASQCAAGNCGATATTAGNFAGANKLGGDATATVVSLTSNSVTVRTDTTRTHWFARFLNIDTSPVQAQATANWGAVSGGSTFPFAISVCQFFWQTGSMSGTPSTSTEFKIDLKSKDKDYPTFPLNCGTQAAHNEVAGGFGWLDPSSPSTCRVDLDANNWVEASPGLPEPCALNLVQGSEYLVPMFDEVTLGGAKARYHISGFAALKITGWCLNHTEQNAYNPCNGNNRHFRGYFVRFVSLEEAKTGGPSTDYGVRTVWLSG